MRLLHAKTMQLFEFWGKDVPPYAILSHTWEEDEVSYQEIQSSKAQSKKGYAKIFLCCNQAIQERIEYVWIDTCCTI
jgi:hypothetical protein